MNERVRRLRDESLHTPITISVERAELITDFYHENIGRFSVPMMRAKALDHCWVVAILAPRRWNTCIETRRFTSATMNWSWASGAPSRGRCRRTPN